MSADLLYFSYGSNMSTRRLLARIAGAIPVGMARLSHHRLCFHKKSHHDDSAKCDAFATGNPQDEVIGVAYEIEPQQLAVLDRFEGLGAGYLRKRVSITLATGQTVQAHTYYATDIDDRLKPLHWYKAHVLAGAREFGLPLDYIRQIEAVAAIADPDPARHAREMAIYAPVNPL